MITDFLLARIAEVKIPDWHTRDCQTHKLMPIGSPLGLGGSPLSCNCGTPTLAMHTAEAMSRIVELHAPRTVTVADYEQYQDGVLACSMCSYPHGTSVGADEYQPFPCSTIRALAQPYRDHMDYRAEWAI